MPEKDAFLLSEENDLDDFVGGATLVSKVDENLCKSLCTQKCECGLFVPQNGPTSLKICDKCKWSLTTEPGAKTVYCSVQNKK